MNMTPARVWLAGARKEFFKQGWPRDLWRVGGATQNERWKRRLYAF
jgi:hypothetical protein